MTTFAAELRHALEARGVTKTEAARRAELGLAAVSELAHAKRSPHITTAAKLAEVLDWPALVTAANRARSGNCEVCGRGYVSRTNRPRKYCATRCQRTAAGRQEVRQRAAPYRVAAFRVRDMQAAIDAFCRRCEPGGICHDEGCELRAVSPLPFVALSSVTRRVA